MSLTIIRLCSYTLSHPENDRDATVTECAKGYTARRVLRASILGFFFERVRKHTCYTSAIISIFLWYAQRRHSCSRGQTKYRLWWWETYDMALVLNFFNI